MAENIKSENLKIINADKDELLQKNKRRLQKDFGLDHNEECEKKKKSKGSYPKIWIDLEKELWKYQKETPKEPTLSLKKCGYRACVRFSSNNQTKLISPLFAYDIYHLLLRSVLGECAEGSIRWADLDVAGKISKTVLVEIEGFSQADVFYMNSELNENNNLFPFVLGMVSSNTSFVAALSTLHLTSEFYNNTKEYYASLFPMQKHTKDVADNSSTQYSTDAKLHLLLNPVQFIEETYPLSQSVFWTKKCDSYIFTKESYIPVTGNSPMFALDCEMVEVASGKSEIARIAIVNENLETIYHTFVKPLEPVKNYWTQFSGITKELLDPVQTRLADVQDVIRKILPSDAILCGQSLNFDLHALKMIHPYIIDTSVIFTNRGIWQRKVSLRQLAKVHLKEIIQEKKEGHDPVEDAVATMKLVQLKLKNCIQGFKANLPSDSATGKAGNKNDHDASASSSSSKVLHFEKLNSVSREDGIFARISQRAKKICLVGHKNMLNNFQSEMHLNSVTKVEKYDVKEIIETASNNLENHNLFISHLTSNSKNNSVSEIKNMLEQLYGKYPNNTIFIVILSNVDTCGNEYFKQSYCMVALKNSES